MDWNKLSEELLKRLDALGPKLGQAGQALWAILLRQAYVDALRDSIFLVLILICAWIWYLKVMPAIEMAREKAAGYNDEGWWVLIIFGNIGQLVLLGIGVHLLYDLPGLLLNPQYYVLKTLLEQVR